MKNLNYLNMYRGHILGEYGDEHNGVFFLEIDGERYAVIASNGEGWEHVSVSHQELMPSWEVMQKVKEAFFHDDEVVMQLHPKKSEYINNHEYCLHLWRPIDKEIPTPPKWMVGIG